ncbi:hypothetical protein Ciccas_008923 [Cichlidogyrus casuarinus]|uniref:UBA domain-containing protein n=1 Tax=Cichlidogyrus casuarinus TaxID=1844966 RepID=A0ABD2Q2W0_9PLAT
MLAVTVTEVAGQMNVFQGSRGRSQMKVGSMESNVWSHEPPNGTGIWEAHYENLGERTAHWQQAAAANNLTGGAGTSNNGQYVMPVNGPAPPKITPFARGQGAATANAPIPSNVASPWEQPTGVMIMDTPQAVPPQRWNAPAPSMEVNMASGPMLSRPLNKGGMMASNNQRWSNGQAPAGLDSGFMGGHPMAAPQVPGAGINQWGGGRLGMGKFSGQGAPWSQPGNDYPNSMMQHPPPHPAGGAPRMLHHNMPHSGQYQGHIRQNIVRQLQSFGIATEDINQSLHRNNMDIEKAVREYSGFHSYFCPSAGDILIETTFLKNRC